MWLLINESKDLPVTVTFAERYRIFDDPELAMKAADEAGLYADSTFGLFEHPRHMRVGVMQRFAQHPIDVKFIRLEVNK